MEMEVDVGISAIRPRSVYGDQVDLEPESHLAASNVSHSAVGHLDYVDDSPTMQPIVVDPALSPASRSDSPSSFFAPSATTPPRSTSSGFVPESSWVHDAAAAEDATVFDHSHGAHFHAHHHHHHHREVNGVKRNPRPRRRSPKTPKTTSMTTTTTTTTTQGPSGASLAVMGAPKVTPRRRSGSNSRNAGAVNGDLANGGGGAGGAHRGGETGGGPLGDTSSFTNAKLGKRRNPGKTRRSRPKKQVHILITDFPGSMRF